MQISDVHKSKLFSKRNHSFSNGDTVPLPIGVSVHPYIGGRVKYRVKLRCGKGGVKQRERSFTSPRKEVTALHDLLGVYYRQLEATGVEAMRYTQKQSAPRRYVVRGTWVTLTVGYPCLERGRFVTKKTYVGKLDSFNIDCLTAHKALELDLHRSMHLVNYLVEFKKYLLSLMRNLEEKYDIKPFIQ